MVSQFADASQNDSVFIYKTFIRQKLVAHKKHTQKKQTYINLINVQLVKNFSARRASWTLGRTKL